MNDIWKLPTKKEIGGVIYGLHADYRDILEIFSYFDDPDLPDFIKWKIALALFYEGEIPEEHFEEAAEYLSYFIRCGQTEKKQSTKKILDWQQDAPAILADMNHFTGREIRDIPFLHWWTFMAWFNGLGEGQLSCILSLRKKLGSGEKLQKWERDFYRENRDLIDLKPRYSSRELEEQSRIRKILGE